MPEQIPGWKSPERRAWRDMLYRCRTETAPAWEHYGGRGITVCEQWQTFANFYADMGPRPSAEHSLDRVDNALGYSPENCRWATPEQQLGNRRSCVLVELEGEHVTLAEASRRSGISARTLWDRHRKGFRGADLFRDPAAYHQAHRVLLDGEPVTLKEAARRLGRPYTYLCKLAKAGRLPAPLQALTGGAHASAA